MSLLKDVAIETQRERRSLVLETERLTLRAPCHGDAKAIAFMVNDRRIAENTARIPHPYSIDDAKRFVAAANRCDGEATFLIALGESLIGACAVEPRESGPELGFWLGPSYWGRGYATEAVRAVVDYAFGSLDHDALVAGTRVSNPAARRVVEKCAFQWTGVGLYRIRAIKSSAPIDRFRLDRKLWLSLKHWRPVRRVA